MKVQMILALSVLAGVACSVRHADATEILTLEQVGGNVVGTATGTINLTDLNSTGSAASSTYLDPQGSSLAMGSSGNIEVYKSILGPSSFGPGGFANASSDNGDFVGIYGAVDIIEVSAGYVSGSALDGTATWDDTTLAALGATPGTYTWTWGSGPDADSLTLDVIAPVPEPSSFTLLALGLIGASFLAFRKTRNSSILGNRDCTPRSCL